MGAATSCIPILERNRNVLQDQIMAENRLIKKNSELALRENEVLEKENAQYKSEVEKLNETIQRLTDNLEALNRKYEEDMANLNDAYKNLSDHFTSLKQESDEKIQALSESKAALEKQFSDEVSKLNVLLRDQKVAFHAERDLLKDSFEFKIKELEARLSLSKQKSDEKDKTIETLEKTHQEDQAWIIALDKTVNEQNEKIKQSEHNYQEIMTSNQQLQKDIDEKQSIIDQLTATINGLQGAPEQTPPQ
jgi:chromosome segregation ATPase